ncbi:hypothetical protein KFE25_006375 [Diacronema lutheri]|uniref:SRCR domain-containing protein n=1 Tax=Diacronema lutheri TaxID=2081491 RepID=A0A8J5XXW3_DIALT|nr:hypothetical protein KFE25_006375 [Diacronema lutheri]
MARSAAASAGATRAKLWNAQNIVALVLVVAVVSVSVATRGPQVHGYICFFDEATCSRAQQIGGRGAVVPSKANASDGAGAAKPVAQVCKMSDMYKLMACKGGGFNDACCRGYDHFFHHNCVCSYDAWPRQYVGDDMSAMTWVRNIMQCNTTYAQVASSSLCIEQLATCAEPAEGDILLSSHPRGLLLLWRHGEWGRVAGPGLTAELATRSCQRLGYAAATEHTDAPATASRYEHEPPTESDLLNQTNQSLSTLRIGVPARVHALDCVAGAGVERCALNVPAPVPEASSDVHDPSPSPSPRVGHGVPHAVGSGGGGAEPERGAWVIACGLALSNGKQAAGPQSCWLARDGSRQCSGSGNVASVACGTAVPKRAR